MLSLAQKTAKNSCLICSPRQSWRTVTVVDAFWLKRQQGHWYEILSAIPKQPSHVYQIRFFSSRYSRAGSRGFKLDALPFSVSPEEALDKFNRWSVDEQGLKYLLNWNSVRIGAAYVPVWSFDLNMRFVLTDASGKKKYDWKPQPFSSIYPKDQSVIHLPGLGAYAGHDYRRSLVHPLVNTTLVFMGDQTVPFEKFMLRDMKLKATGDPIHITPDPWNATRAQAFSTLVEDLENIAGNADGAVKVQTEIVKSRRVYLPIFVIEYSVLGMEYQAFTSGADAAAGVSGVNHQIFKGFPTKDVNQASQTFLSSSFEYAQRAAQVGFRTLGGRNFFTIIAVLLQFFGSVMARVLIRIPFVAFFGGLFVGLKKILLPWIDNRRASAEWERQREHEAQMRDDPLHKFGDDFVDSGSAQTYFYRNKGRILSYLAGSEEHDRGDYDWYKDWEEWARRQWEQQQRQQNQDYQQYRRTYGQQQQQQQQQQKQQTYNQRTQRKSQQQYEWDFNPDDPYTVLGIPRGATKQEVAAAFRREMLKHHPDVQAGASEAQKLRAVERSKHITEAYRKIKKEMK